MVLVALDHALGAVEVGGLPLGVDAEQLDGAAAVGLEVGLVDDVEAVAVAQGVEARVVRVVGGADGVDVVALHHGDVACHRLERDRVAEVGVRVVAVDASEQDGPAIHQHLLALDLDGAEADLEALDLQDAALGVLQREQQLIEAGGLGRPLARRRDPRGHRDGALSLGAELGRPAHAPLQDDLALGIEEPCGHGARPGRLGAVVSDCRADLELRVLVCLIQRRADPHVAHVDGGRREEIDVAEDAVEPPEVLVLEIRPVRPLEHLHGQHVVPWAHEPRDVELRGDVRPLAVADGLAVEPDVEGRVDAVEVQEHLPPRPSLGQREAPAIAADGIVVGHEGRIDGVGVPHVRVVRPPVAVHLPVARHGQGVPAGDIELGLLESLGDASRRRRIAEVPRAAQELEPRRRPPLGRPCRRLVGAGQQRRVCRLAVPLKHVLILPVGNALRHRCSFSCRIADTAGPA